MRVNPVSIAYTCPVMVQTEEGTYINSNNITNMSKIDNHWFVHCDEFGCNTKYNVEDEEVQKVLNICA